MYINSKLCWNAKWHELQNTRLYKSNGLCFNIVYYHRFRLYATLENKTLGEAFSKFPPVVRVIDRSDRNPPITATSVTFWPSLRHASGLWLVRLTEILETFPRVLYFPKPHINENGGKRNHLNAKSALIIFIRKFVFRLFARVREFKIPSNIIPHRFSWTLESVK